MNPFATLSDDDRAALNEAGKLVEGVAQRNHLTSGGQAMLLISAILREIDVLGKYLGVNGGAR